MNEAQTRLNKIDPKLRDAGCMSAGERDEVKKLYRRFKNLFASKMNLKEKKGEGGKEKIPPHPPIKEKASQRIDKETSPCVGDADDFSEAFRKECLGFVGQYDMQLLTDFFNYWSEANPRTGKMRFQGKRYWDTRKRLIANGCWRAFRRTIRDKRRPF